MKRAMLPLVLMMAACGSRTSPAPVDPKDSGPATLEVNGSPYRVTGPYAHERLAVYLIHADKTDERDFLTLDEGLQAKTVEVTEKQQEQVSELMLENRSDRPLFIQEGDRVVGGKQDRIIGMSFVVPPRSGRMPVPSFCVEASRWTAGRHGKGFVAGDNLALAPKSVREAAKYAKDQGAVWNRVAEEKRAASDGLNVPNKESSLNEALENEKVKKLCEAYAAALGPVVERNRDAVGVAIVLNGRIEEVDLYPGNALLKKLYARLIQSYAPIAATQKDAAVAPPAPAEIVRFMNEDKANARQREEKINDKNELLLLEYEKQIRSESQYEGKSVHAQWMRRSEAPVNAGPGNVRPQRNEFDQQRQEQRGPNE